MHDHKQTQEAPVYSARELIHSDSAKSLSHSQNHNLFPKNTETGLANTFVYIQKESRLAILRTSQTR